MGRKSVKPHPKRREKLNQLLPCVSFDFVYFDNAMKNNYVSNPVGCPVTLPVPVLAGCIYHHYQEVYQREGRKGARAKQSDSGIGWIVLSGTVSETELANFLSWYGLDSGVRINSDYDCTGRYFSQGATVIRHKHRILITQSWGYDI